MGARGVCVVKLNIYRVNPVVKGGSRLPVDRSETETLDNNGREWFVEA